MDSSRSEMPTLVTKVVPGHVAPPKPSPLGSHSDAVTFASSFPQAWLKCARPGHTRAMNRGTGTGLIAFGIVLGVVGAILAFAVTVEATGFNINTAGTILLVVGIIVLVIGIAIFVAGSRRSSTTVESVQNTPTGQERVQEHRDSGTP
jgi:hypothetical protein